MNNFDQSSTGINLELSACFDTFLSQCIFDENMNRDEYLTDHFHFIDYGNHETIDLLDTDNYTFTKADIIDGLKSFMSCDLDYLKQCFLEDQGFSFSKATKSDLIEYVETIVYNSTETISFYINNFKCKFELITVTGYCQGDRNTVIFSHEAMKDYTFKDKEKFLSMKRKYFCNLFYDVPVYARLTIENNHSIEIDLMEFLESEYKWDKDRILERLINSNLLSDYENKKKKEYY